MTAQPGPSIDELMSFITPEALALLEVFKTLDDLQQRKVLDMMAAARVAEESRSTEGEHQGGSADVERKPK